ncbi:helix-turn-helix domain-containing protein [Nocardiopsis suaedae]|uniref:Helix-turn-helix transcriptional regulator n=1 Tax=Nocardiopsis suaedae TaxID=3018444 RepID=A0ABT4TQ46_9ACTN|nr:helix-turn-helix transcriptional regulator [Nocardiopsis suaedae]MDA2806277.1 helix-turn-helix transcriptional regulator [Nocardiopsis suaedae]
MTRRGPTVARRSLARLLRERRKELGISREQVAKHAGIAPPTVNRIESASVRVEVGTVAMMLDLYNVTAEEREELLDMARAAKKRGWWQRYSYKIPSWFSVYVGLEHEAKSLFQYQIEVIPGLLQTEAYTRALIDAEPAAVSPEEADRRVTVRKARQARLTGDTPPKLWAIINEAALYRQIGGHQVMRDQLDHLVALAQLDNVTIQVLPNAAGAHPAGETPFTILGFADTRDRDVVYIEYRMGAIYLEAPEEVEMYTTLFDHLTMKAPDRERSIALLDRAAAAFTDKR